MRAALALLGCLSGLPLLSGATLERLSLDDMILKSTAIVRGRVVGSHASFRGSVIYTHYNVAVSDRWKGPNQASLDVVVPGGVANGLRQVYSGAPQLAPNQEYILFLWSSSSGLTHVIGFTQGVFQLVKPTPAQAVARRAATTEPMVDGATGELVKDQRIEIPLSQLVDRIQKTLGSTNR